jgi:hypothetical protein
MWVLRAAQKLVVVVVCVVAACSCLQLNKEAMLLCRVASLLPQTQHLLHF